jgi:hypothetical protein
MTIPNSFLTTDPNAGKLRIQEPIEGLRVSDLPIAFQAELQESRPDETEVRQGRNILTQLSAPEPVVDDKKPAFMSVQLEPDGPSYQVKVNDVPRRIYIDEDNIRSSLQDTVFGIKKTLGWDAYHQVDPTKFLQQLHDCYFDPNAHRTDVNPENIAAIKEKYPLVEKVAQRLFGYELYHKNEIPEDGITPGQNHSKSVINIIQK